ncbi:DUF5994 family protein [Streptomyces sp. NPDC050564]|uniref:DUF5994 family protein n=1 Tax=Streptomyces sp. NPDC050564 TaxID=3365631 RepID=UPI0037922A00
MTATVSYTPIFEDRPSSPSLRMSPTLTGSAPAPLDGSWWPRSRDLGAEFPSLTAVLDPQTTPVSAVWLMAAASDPLRTSTTGRLMEEAARLRTVSETDWAVQAVWDAEGGHKARDPIARPRIPAVTAPVLGITPVALPIPNRARGM